MSQGKMLAVMYTKLISYLMIKYETCNFLSTDIVHLSNKVLDIGLVNITDYSCKDPNEYGVTYNLKTKRLSYFSFRELTFVKT